MSDCCSTSSRANSAPRKYQCPVNGKEYSSVSSTTIMHHIKQPWDWVTKDQGYYFCDDPECEVVYFGQDNSVIERKALRTEVGVKQKSTNALLCYCFGLNKSDAATHPEAKAFIVRKTKEHTCACEIRNPSGKCCLKDFPKK